MEKEKMTMALTATAVAATLAIAAMIPKKHDAPKAPEVHGDKFVGLSAEGKTLCKLYEKKSDDGKTTQYKVCEK